MQLYQFKGTEIVRTYLDVDLTPDKYITIFEFSLKMGQAKTAHLILSRQTLHQEVSEWATELAKQTRTIVTWRYSTDYTGMIRFTVYDPKHAMMFKLRFC